MVLQFELVLPSRNYLLIDIGRIYNHEQQGLQLNDLILFYQLPCPKHFDKVHT
jgi:hypothetical protein